LDLHTLAAEGNALRAQRTAIYSAGIKMASHPSTGPPRKGQLALALPEAPVGWGGRRRGAGRPPRKQGRKVAHATRPFHEWREPVHVTLRARRGIPLRSKRLAAVVGEAIRKASTDPGAAAAARRRTFRVVHFSIQPDHLHLIVEASGRQALARGMQGLASRLARRVNARLGRRGALFADRYHGRALATPLEVRRAIAYVLTNAAKHEDPIPDQGTEVHEGLDPCSSARWFGGWQHPPPRQATPSPVAEPTVWLLRVGWKRHGLLRRDERPARARPAAT
jgi:REP element-mobilizing transposase RayT